MLENRRRTVRLPAGWAAFCHLAGESAIEWHACQVIDISKLGLGITFDYPEQSELSGRHISVNLPGNASSINVRLEGVIKNIAPTIDGSLRVGIEFAGLSETEQAITVVLSAMNDMLVKS